MANEKAQIASVLFDASHGGLGVACAGLMAARKGWAGLSKVNEKSSINAETVLTDVGFLVAIPSGKQLALTGTYSHINTASDYVDYEFGTTTNADGSGTFTVLSPKFRIESPAVNQASKPGVMPLPCAMIIKYSATAKAFTFRVKANDAGCTVTFGFEYWLEPLTEDE